MPDPQLQPLTLPEAPENQRDRYKEQYLPPPKGSKRPIDDLRQHRTEPWDELPLGRIPGESDEQFAARQEEQKIKQLSTRLKKISSQLSIDKRNSCQT